jgi:hypothetical protein
MNDDETPSKLLKRSINKFGELHLDKERAAIVVGWLETNERNNLEMRTIFLDLIKLLAPVMGEEAAKKMIESLTE